MTQFGLKEALSTLLERQPSGRIGKWEDFAVLILFLSSAAAAHMTGGVFEIDGGSTQSRFRSKGKPKNKL